jgi:response regulator RpfG family c-di-GMP phosphodiesterase
LGTETILLVENDSAMRDYLAWTLRELGYTVIEAKEGHDALCLLHNSPGRPIDLLLAEATMPRMGGKQLAHKVASLIPKSRILIVAAFPEELAIHGDLLDTALAFIQKPITRRSLAIKVREVLDTAYLASLITDSETVMA